MQMPRSSLFIIIINFIIQCNSDTHMDAARFLSESTSPESSQVDNVGSGTKFTALLTARIGQPPPNCGSDSGVWQSQGTESPQEPLTTPGQGTRSPPIKFFASSTPILDWHPTQARTLGPPPYPPLNHLEYLEDRSDKAFPDEALLKEEHAKLIMEINKLIEINTISPDFIHDHQLVNDNRLKRGGSEVHLADESKDESFFVEDILMHATSVRPSALTNTDPVRTPYSTIDQMQVIVMKPVHPSRPRHPYPFVRPVPPGIRPDTSTAAGSLRPVDNRYFKPKHPYSLKGLSLWDRFISLFPRLV